jgi:hypothetical protein
MSEPWGWVQWKGTDACVDLHCPCGTQWHEDGEFLYKVRCPGCSTEWFLNGHITLHATVPRLDADNLTSEFYLIRLASVNNFRPQQATIVER